MSLGSQRVNLHRQVQMLCLIVRTQRTMDDEQCGMQCSARGTARSRWNARPESVYDSFESCTSASEMSIGR
jgi:hypothetical protein